MDDAQLGFWIFYGVASTLIFAYIGIVTWRRRSVARAKEALKLHPAGYTCACPEDEDVCQKHRKGWPSLRPGTLGPCTNANPCCDRRDEYNGYGSDGPTVFRCPLGCPCHD